MYSAKKKNIAIFKLISFHSIMTYHPCLITTFPTTLWSTIIYCHWRWFFLPVENNEDEALSRKSWKNLDVDSELDRKHINSHRGTSNFDNDNRWHRGRGNLGFATIMSPTTTLFPSFNFFNLKISTKIAPFSLRLLSPIWILPRSKRRWWSDKLNSFVTTIVEREWGWKRWRVDEGDRVH